MSSRFNRAACSSSPLRVPPLVPLRGDVHERARDARAGDAVPDDLLILLERRVPCTMTPRRERVPRRGTVTSTRPEGQRRRSQRAAAHRWLSDCSCRPSEHRRHAASVCRQPMPTAKTFVSTLTRRRTATRCLTASFVSPMAPN